MFEDNHMDKDGLLLRSILQNGQEEVPDRVWNGVTEGLDRISHRRRFLWSSVASVAAAAAVAVGLVLWTEEEGLVLPEASGDMIAVVENHADASEGQLLAEAAEIVPALKDRCATSNIPDIQTGDSSVPEVSSSVSVTPSQEYEIPSEMSEKPSTESVYPSSTEPTAFSSEESWAEDDREIKASRARASVTLSGIAGMNNPQGKSGRGPLRSPGMLSSPQKTTLKHVGSDDKYGIPLSFGVGVKLNVSQKWSIGLGVNYSMLTNSFDGSYIKVSDGVPDLPIYARVLNTQHYIGIPLNAYYNIVSSNFINFYAYAGGTVERCVGNTYEIQTTPVIHHTEPVKGVQLSVNAGIGAEFMIGRHVGLYIDPSLRYYFRCGQPRSIRTAKPLIPGFEMGFRFKL